MTEREEEENWLLVVLTERYGPVKARLIVQYEFKPEHIEMARIERNEQ